jgi:hypothetical protein
MTIPAWLFDLLADELGADLEELEARLAAWEALLQGATEEPTTATRTTR